MKHLVRPTLVCILTFGLTACGDTPFDNSQSPVCTGETTAGRLLVTTTDFSTGAISVVSLADRTVDADVALGSTDAIPFFHDGKAYIIHRFGSDYVDILDPVACFASVGQHAVTTADAVSTNPHAVAFAPDGLGYLTLMGAPYVQVFDFSQPSGSALVDSIDLSSFADADGNPELSLAIAHGDQILVSAQLLDPSFDSTANDILIRIDTTTRAVTGTPITLQGTFGKQVRPDPSDPSGDTVLILSTGIERVNLATGAVSWAVDESLFAAERLGAWQIQAFALYGDDAYVAAYDPEPEYGVDVWRVALSGPQTLEMVLSGFNAVEKTLEIVGDELWFGDTTTGAEGLRVFDLTASPPQQMAGPLSTGLPPYSMIVIP